MRILIEEYQYTLTDEERQHDQFDAIKEKSGFSYVEADGYQVIKGINKRGMSNFLKLCAEKLGHNITIE